MAVFSTNLLIYKHTDFEQTFILEDSQSNSAKDLTGFTGTCKMQRTLNLGSLTAFNLAFTNTTNQNTLSLEFILSVRVFILNLRNLRDKRSKRCF